MAAKKAVKKKREATVMVSVRFPPDLEERAQVAARFHKVSFQSYIQNAVRLALGATSDGF